MRELKLTEPSMEYEKQIREYRQEFLDEGGSMDGCGALRRFSEPIDWLKETEALSRKETCPEAFVPASQYICIRESDKKMVGVIQIRHYFNEYLEKYAGHIGYSVAPSERRKGYATWMLHEVLPLCRKLGIKDILVCCYDDNEGSRRTILKNGGVYESTVYEPDREKFIERYWIHLK